MEIRAFIYSLSAPGKVEEIRKLPGDNCYAAKRGEYWYSALWNPFSGYYYVDDLYGQMPSEKAESGERWEVF